MRKYLLCCLFFFIAYKSYSTHLVGGEMNYRYVGEDVYEISLIVYRDCYLGEPDFDYPASILVYTGGGTFMGAFSILGDPKILLPVVIDDECFSAPPNVCVERKLYRFRGQLPLNSEGYYLSYQRCCRNRTILNIFDDKTDNVADSGLNLFAYIPPRTTLNNSNPTFVNYPPVAICVDKPLVFDHKATDVDGDSLAYKLCVPTDALSPLYPTAYPGNYDTPPFADVRWRNPYSLADVLGGPEKLKIDSKTGLLTAYPSTVGQFVVGVCVEEYRNGTFIAETKRDFQFNVSVCGKFSVSSFFSFDTICNSLEVSFKNESIEADNFRWNFGDGEFSTAKDPTHKFPGYGEYNIMLIASTENGCADTMSKKIVLKPDDFSFNISDVSVCKGDSALLKIQASNNQDIKSIHWLLTPSVYTSKPELSYLPTKSGEVQFEIHNTKGCIYTGSVDVNVYDKPVISIDVKPDLIIAQQQVILSTVNRDGYQYLWETKDVNSTPRSYQTSFTITESQWAYLTVNQNASNCSARDSVYLKMDSCDFGDAYKISKTTDFHCNDLTLKVSALSLVPDLQYSWIVDGELIQEEEFTRVLGYNQPLTYQLIIEEHELCKDTITFTDNYPNPYLTAEFPTYNLCKEDTSLTVHLNIQSDLDYTINWAQNILQNTDSFTIQFSGQNISLPVIISYSDTCVLTGTVRVNVADVSVNASAEPAIVLKGKETTLSATPQGFDSYQWYPENIPSDPTEAQTTAILYETTDFIVVVRDQNGCLATDTVRVEVKDDRCSEENIYIPTAFTPNGDGVNDVWRVRSGDVTDITVAIYNRWGEKVFESHDITQGWDGSYKGKSAESGSYSYYLTITCENQLQYFSKGNITLMR